MKGRLHRTLLLMLTATVYGCGCDPVGCVDGLLVTFDSPPTAPWKAELLINGVLQPDATESSCDGTRACPTSVLFRTFERDGVAVRITSGTSARTTSISPVSYEPTRRNAGACSECGGMAIVSVPVPD